jgi:hypothetical protein
MVEYYKEKLNVALMALALVEDGAYRKCEEIGKKLCIATTVTEIVAARDSLDTLVEVLSQATNEVEDLELRLEEAADKRKEEK